ncbi:MAG: alanine racemase [Acidobacteriota bacterium]
MRALNKPTLLLDPSRARLNIRTMAEKARRLGLHFRPHFKTHQSRAVGRIFREFGESSITVSSVDMARFFAEDGWRDILIAFPVNVREADEIRKLASAVRLGLLVESPDAVRGLAGDWPAPVDVWLKIDTGNHRTGIAWDAPERIAAVADEVKALAGLRLKGLLTHNGLTYATRSLADLRAVHGESVRRMRAARAALAGRGFEGVAISVGDTPSCKMLEDFDGVDEIRPGNFVFHDVMQLEIGSCAEDEIAVAVACPVVALHPERNEAVIFGGAIHLSKESVETREGGKIYGRACLPEGDGWGKILPGTAVVAASQEHGIVRTTPEILARLRVGDFLVILPVHSCLTVNLWREYVSLSGVPFDTMRSPDGPAGDRRTIA